MVQLRRKYVVATLLIVPCMIMLLATFDSQGFHNTYLVDAVHIQLLHN